MLGCGLPAPRLGKHPRTSQLVLVGGLGLQMGGLRRATGLLGISPAPGPKGSRMSPGVICLACCAGGWDGAGMEAGWRLDRGGGDRAGAHGALGERHRASESG